MKDDSLHPWIEPELEARIVALVVGEASDFETEELERLIEEKPELGLFRQRMESLHGMLRTNAKGDVISDDDDWKLSTEKRDAVLSVVQRAPEGKPEVETEKAEKNQGWNWKSVMKFAAMIALSALVLGSAGLTFFSMANSEHRASSTYSAGNRSDGFDLAILESTRVIAQNDDLSRLDNEANGAFRYRSADDDDGDVAAERDHYERPVALSESVDDLAMTGTAMSSLDVESVDFLKGGTDRKVYPGRSSREKEVADIVRKFAKVGHGGHGGGEGVSGDVAVSAGGEITLKQEAEKPVEGDDGLERPVLESLKPDEGNAHSLAKVTEPHQQRRNKEMDFGFDWKSNSQGLKFPEEPAAPVTNAGSIRGGKGGGEIMDSDKVRVFGGGGVGGVADRNDGEVSAGYVSDYAFVSPRDLVERESLIKQHGGTVRIDGGHDGVASSDSDVLHGGVSLSVNFGEEQEEAESVRDESGRFHIGATATFGDEQKDVDTRQVMTRGAKAIVREMGRVSDAIALQTKAESPKVGQISAKGNTKTKDRVIRRELPAIAAAPIVTGDLSITSGLRSGAVAIERKTVDSLIRAASTQTISAELAEDSAEEKPFSTFSLHVSDVSFKLAQAALAKGEWPDAERIRIEEFVNAFDYGDPLPSQDEKVAANLEQAIHPFLQQRNLLRVSMRTAATGRSSTTPLRLTFLLDNSGSMERADRRETVQKAFAMLASMLQPADQVTLVSFARQPRLLADRVSGDQAAGLVETVKNLPSEGGTNLEAALALAFEKAKEQQVPGAQNRIILLTDGAANLGDAEPLRLADKVEQMRNGGIAFDAAGIGTEGLNDEILEALTRKGDGRYYLLDRADDVDAGFAKQIAGALRPAAGNVKVQIEFNSERIGKYKLLGFEKHRLKKEDFRNDKVDAAELAAAEAGVAVYQVEVKPDGKGDLGSAFVRFRDMTTGEMTERRWTIPYQSHPARPEVAAPSMQVATVAAMLGAKLKGDVLGEVVDLNALVQIVSGLPESWKEKPRVAELKMMLESARAIAGN